MVGVYTIHCPARSLLEAYPPPLSDRINPIAVVARRRQCAAAAPQGNELEEPCR